MSLRVAFALALALGLLGAPAAEAHRRPASIPATLEAAVAPAPVAAVVDDPPPVLRASPSFQPSPWLAAAALGAAVALRGLGRSRDARRWALVLLFASFTAEIAVHAVHHLDDPRGAASCYALSLGQHLNAASSPGPDLAGPAHATTALLGLRPQPAAVSAPRALDRGRAPPLRPA